jgi:hypothetical protein
MKAVAHGHYSVASPCLNGRFEKSRVGARPTGMGPGATTYTHRAECGSMAVRHYARGDTDKTVVHETRGAPGSKLSKSTAELWFRDPAGRPVAA